MLGFLGQEALHLGSLARVQQRAGKQVEAASSMRRALAAATAGGDGRMAATARLTLARLLRIAGDGTAAVSLLEENLAWYADAGGGDGALLSRCVLAAETADRDSLEVVLTLARADANQLVTVLALDALAKLGADRGDHSCATRLLAEADALHPAVAHRLDEADRPDRAAALASLQTP